jgi:hypothetical protein
MSNARRRYIAYFMLLVTISLNVIFWTHSSTVRAMWSNVPPVPTENGATTITLGDGQLFYRVAGIMLQNLGDLGGMSTKMELYNYPMLRNWFMLSDILDSESNFFPILAAFYYGPTADPKDVRYVNEYLVKIGSRKEGEKWRWLAQAVHLARYRQNDINEAFRLAEMLAKHPNQDRPAWTYQMPAFVMNAKGDRQAAYEIIMNLLKTEAEKMHPVEVNFMVYYICDRLLTELERDNDPLCTARKEDTE